jgi:arginyl-tRNA synthetase
MKININILKEIPKNFGSGLCVYGKPSEEVSSWINYHNFETELSGSFTNIIIPEDLDINTAFYINEQYEYIDGISPNLNKYTHLGHISNFVLAKTFQKLGIGKQFIANLGDTLEGNVKKEDALKVYQEICNTFDYKIDKIFFASELEYTGELLENGQGEYEGTKIFNINDKKLVGIKSNGATSYFYQDVALASILNSKTLYMTGLEQGEHFKSLKILFPNVEHLPLGLVMVKGEKMSSRLGNVILFSEIIDMFKEKFGDNDKLVWNVLAGYILKSIPGTNKNIDLDQLDNVKMSAGLYLSYTLAKLKSAGLVVNDISDFNSVFLKIKTLKAKNSLSPNILFEALVEQAKKISGLYELYQIKGNDDNQKMFNPLAEDLLFGMKLLGLYDIDKV